MEFYAIGDIHGMADLAEQADAFLRDKLRDRKSHAIFLGDYIDRGDRELRTLEILDGLRKTFPDRCHFLIGNHEFWMIRLIHLALQESDEFDNMFDHCWASGGFTTLKSLGGESDLLTNLQANIVRFIPFFNSLVGKVSINTGQRFLNKNVKGFRLTHAGAWDGESSDPEILRRVNSRLFNKTGFSENIATAYIKGKGIARPHNINVYGHTITSENIITKQVNSDSFRPLDAGSFLEGKLAIASLLRPRIYYRYDRMHTAINHCPASLEEYSRTLNDGHKKESYAQLFYERVCDKELFKTLKQETILCKKFRILNGTEESPRALHHPQFNSFREKTNIVVPAGINFALGSKPMSMGSMPATDLRMSDAEMAEFSQDMGFSSSTEKLNPAPSASAFSMPFRGTAPPAQAAPIAVPIPVPVPVGSGMDGVDLSSQIGRLEKTTGLKFAPGVNPFSTESMIAFAKSMNMSPEDMAEIGLLPAVPTLPAVIPSGSPDPDLLGIGSFSYRGIDPSAQPQQMQHAAPPAAALPAVPQIAVPPAQFAAPQAAALPAVPPLDRQHRQGAPVVFGKRGYPWGNVTDPTAPPSKRRKH